MLRVILEIVPHGDMERRQELGQLVIINDGTGTPEIGNYEIALLEEDEGYKNRLEAWPRSDPSEKGNAWELVQAALLTLMQAPDTDAKAYARCARVGDVVQIDPSLQNCFFPGCFLQVTEVKSWGVQGFICMPQTRTELPGHAYFRAAWDQIIYVGHAAWMPQELEEEELHA